MAIVRTRDLEMQLEEGQHEQQLLKDQLDQADSEKEKLKEQAALDKERWVLQIPLLAKSNLQPQNI